MYICFYPINFFCKIKHGMFFTSKKPAVTHLALNTRGVNNGFSTLT